MTVKSASLAFSSRTNMAARNKSICLGRYEGIQQSETFSAEIVIDENNLKPHKLADKYPYSFEGFLEWRITLLAKARNQAILNTIYMERVRGFYYNYDSLTTNDNNDNNQPPNHKMTCMGCQVFKSKDNGDAGDFQPDGYRFNLNPEYKTIESFVCNDGQWDTPISIKRVASKNELIELLTDKFGNEKGIVIIVSDMLHRFIKPDIEIQTDALNIRRLLAYQQKNCQILKPLFNDILDIDKERKVQIDIGSNGGIRTVGCVVICEEDDGWCLCVENEGAESKDDVKFHWLHRREVNELNQELNSNENENN